MNKKILIILVILFGGMAFVFYEFKTKLPKEEEVINNPVAEKALIGDINNVELYVTDYRYNRNIPGYNYTKVELTSDQIEKIKKELVNVDLNQNIQDVVYGKYKLVVDNKTIFFDINNDSALYLEGNKTFRLSNDIKKIVAISNDTCSCCSTSNCKINLCACPTN